MQSERRGQALSALTVLIAGWLVVRVATVAMTGGGEAAQALSIASQPHGVDRDEPARSRVSAGRADAGTAPTPAYDPAARAAATVFPAVGSPASRPDPYPLGRPRPTFVAPATRWPAPLPVTEAPDGAAAAREQRMRQLIGSAMHHSSLFPSPQMVAPVRDGTAAGRISDAVTLSSLHPGLVAAPPGPDVIDNPSVRRLQFHAYGFFRGGDGDAALASGGAYGGSQAALIARFAIDRASAERWQLTGRVSRAIARNDPLELSPGLRWRPDDALPIAIHGEYRFRKGSGDGPALFATAWLSDRNLPAKFRVESWIQAGIVRNRESVGFVDAAAVAVRPIQTAGPRETGGLSAGGGIWAGGQKGAGRLDIGPVLTLDVALAASRLRLTGAWRERIAGQARPGSGPALTISSDF